MDTKDETYVLLEKLIYLKREGDDIYYTMHNDS